MRALLLAAGYGKRLRPITNSVPKCMVPIKGKPLLQIWLENLTAVNIKPILINTHYLADQVEEFIVCSPFKENVTITYEPKLLGTAATLLANLEFFVGDDLMLIHADNYTQADLQEFMAAHTRRPNHCMMTMMLFRTNDPSSCGIVELDESGVMKKIHEKVSNPPSNLANGAVYILSPEMLSWLKNCNRKVKDFSTDVLIAMEGKIFTYETVENFVDIGTPKNYYENN